MPKKKSAIEVLRASIESDIKWRESLFKTEVEKLHDLVVSRDNTVYVGLWDLIQGVVSHYAGLQHRRIVLAEIRNAATQVPQENAFGKGDQRKGCLK